TPRRGAQRAFSPHSPRRGRSPEDLREDWLSAGPAAILHKDRFALKSCRASPSAPMRVPQASGRAQFQWRISFLSWAMPVEEPAHGSAEPRKFARNAPPQQKAVAVVVQAESW